MPSQPLRLAVLSDLHANLSALTAVSEDVRQRGVARVLVLGDLVGYLTRPNQVAALVAEQGWDCIAGNYDLAVLTGGRPAVDRYLKPGIGPEPLAVFHWTEAALDPATRAYLAGLPPRLQLNLAGRRILAVHGSPDQVRQYVLPDHPRAELEAWLAREAADLLLLGHTHQPFVARLAGGGLAVNPGSVGYPKDGDPRASYALIELGPEVAVQIIRVAYDASAEAQRLTAAGLPPSGAAKLLAGR